jgi:hypothetical protein
MYVFELPIVAMDLAVFAKVIEEVDLTFETGERDDSDDDTDTEEL